MPHVVKQPQTPPVQILFFDDNPIDVESARACGLHAHHLSGFAERCAALRSLGFSPE